MGPYTAERGGDVRDHRRSRAIAGVRPSGAARAAQPGPAGVQGEAVQAETRIRTHGMRHHWR